jgi:hypothetical protein
VKQAGIERGRKVRVDTTAMETTFSALEYGYGCGRLRYKMEMTHRNRGTSESAGAIARVS